MVSPGARTSLSAAVDLQDQPGPRIRCLGQIFATELRRRGTDTCALKVTLGCRTERAALRDDRGRLRRSITMCQGNVLAIKVFRIGNEEV
jgi:hypothetical protein